MTTIRKEPVQEVIQKIFMPEKQGRKDEACELRNQLLERLRPAVGRGVE